MKITEGDPASLGVRPTETGVLVSVASERASRIELCLFEEDGREQRIALPGREGPIFHAHIGGITPGALYGLRAHGPWDPSRGLLFNPAKLLIDPYAIELDAAPRWHECQRTDQPDGARDPVDSASYVPKAIVRSPPPERLAPPLYPLAETILYELHVRGFTKRHPQVPPDRQGTFAGLAHPAVIAHLKAIGVTTVELLPVTAAIEERHLAALGLHNYWGYNPVAFLAPDPRLAPEGWEEVRAATGALYAAGIETILDVVFNHTGEGDAEGPTISLRGLDNTAYFRVLSNGKLANDTGTGNQLAMDHPQMLQLALDSLRAWALWGGVQGFRFDLAATLGRFHGSFDGRAPFLQAIAQDPVLRRLKLIAEPWDVGFGGWQTGKFPPPFAEWNDRYRDDIRRYWRGDPGLIGALATRLSGSSDLFAGRPAAHSINFVTAHDGFTLADLVSYERKHNEANGEGNHDGTDSNNSWNNGVEGPSADPEVIAARRRDQGALLATLLLSRGTPMLSQGAELGESQGGNNNAYAQDNDTAWLDWATADPALMEITAQLTRFRAANAWAWRGDALAGSGFLYPDVCWFNASGFLNGAVDWNNPYADVLVMVRTGGTSRFTVIFQRARTPRAVVLPPARPRRAWQLVLSTAPMPRPEVGTHQAGDTLLCPARAVVLLQEEVMTQRDQAPSDAAVARLAEAAGVDTAWWDVTGNRHEVPVTTLRTLLAGLGFPAETRGDVDESLIRLSDQARRIPIAYAFRRNRPARLPIPLGAGANPAPIVLEVTNEAGETRRMPVSPEAGAVVTRQTPDRREHQEWCIELPDLQPGRYRIEYEGSACALTVAPESCYQPLKQPVAGLTVQLYSLRRQGDQGIGDFTTLTRAAEFTAQNGAVLLGINPLHALFPHQRERTSPYNPSDRRFLDPIMIDLAAPDPGLETPAVRALLERHADHIAALSAAASVDYPAVWMLKEQILRAADRTGPEFAAYKEHASTALRDFALFSALSNAFPTQSWQSWAGPLRDRESEALADARTQYADEIEFQLYLQFLAERGMARAGGGLSLGLLRDLAVGAAGDGAECWAHQEIFVQTASIGAPPDPLAPQGQVWALPPPNPHGWRAAGFAPFAELAAANMRHAGALRIDHVLGLKRLFWVPNGATPAEGAYVAAPMDNLFCELALESHRARCMVVGEDLGTVPPGLRESMEDYGMLRNRVLLLDYEHGQFPPPSTYPVLCATSVASHDMPTLRGWAKAADVDERAQLGIFDAATAERERAARKEAVSALEKAAGGIDATHVHRHIARTPSLIATAQIEDLAGEEVSVNLPGTDKERPNWRRKIAVPVEALNGTVIRAMAEERAGK